MTWIPLIISSVPRFPAQRVSMVTEAGALHRQAQNTVGVTGSFLADDKPASVFLAHESVLVTLRD